MKKIFVFALFLGVVISTTAQDRIGLELGGSFSNFLGDQLPTSREGLTTLTPGLFYEFFVSDDVTIKTVGSYQTKGYEANIVLGIGNEDDVFVQDQKTVSKNDYLILNPMVKYYVGNKVQFFVNGGPFLGIVLKDESVTSKPIDYGLSLGLGLQLDLGSYQIFLEGRDSLGLTNLVETSLPINGDIRSNAFSVFIGTSMNLD